MDNKKDNFKRISENRVSKILVLLTQLTNLTNTSFYEYSKDDIDKIFSNIELEVKNSKEVLLKALDGYNKKKRFEL